MRNLIRALRGKPVELSPKQQEKMARMQARADAMIAEQEAKGRAAQEEAARFMSSQGAATSVSGPGDAARAAAPPQAPAGLGDAFRQAVEGFKDVFAEGFDNRAGVIDPGPGADMNRPPKELEDPGERARVAAQERAARDAARAPYRAADVPQVAFTRIATTGRTQLTDIVEQLRAAGLSARPDRVFGVYRVPDRFNHNRMNERRAYVEWEIAHQPGDLPPSPDGVQTVAMPRELRWVRRRIGEPSVLDEDISGTLCARAGLGPEDCFGLPRLLHVSGRQTDNDTTWYGEIEGAMVLSRPSDALTRAHKEMLEQAPLALPPRPMLPFHLELLDWEAVAAWVAAKRFGSPRVPSPLPHLPSGWNELLVAYLEIVGVRSDDCYGVQVTRSSAKPLGDLSMAGGEPFNKPKFPCADGEERALVHVAEHVVIAYRDRAEYQEGRERWRAYQDDVLHAELDHLTGLRPPIEVDLTPRASFMSEVLDMVNPLDPWAMFPQVFGRNEKPSLGPYCGEYEG